MRIDVIRQLCNELMNTEKLEILYILKSYQLLGGRVLGPL